MKVKVGKILRQMSTQKCAFIFLRSVGVVLIVVFSSLALSAQNRPIPADDCNTRSGTQETEFFNNSNPGGTLNGPGKPTVLTLDCPARITALNTYHWNSARGAQPGTISLRDQNGKIYGPFAATGSSGSGGVPNVDWTAKTNITVPAGTYTVLDSDTGTWSNNAESGFAGFAKVHGYFLSSSAPNNKKGPNSPIQSALRVFSAVPRQASSVFKANAENSLLIPPPNFYDKVPYHITKPFETTLTVLPNQRFKLAGNATGTGKWSVDNFIFVQIEGSREKYQFIIGDVPNVTYSGKQIPNIRPGFGHDPLDLTSYFTGQGPVKVKIWALDYGVVGQVSDLFLIIEGDEGPDLVVNNFSIEPYEGKDVNGAPKTAWRVRAEVINIGSEPAMERFRVELVRRSNIKTRPSEYSVADSRIYLQRLQPGKSAVIEWDTERQTDQTSPPNIVKDDSEISVVVDPENVVSETSEENNRATLLRLECSGPNQTPNYLNTIWIEKFSRSSGIDDYYPLIGNFTKPEEAVLCYIRLEARRRAKNDYASAIVSKFVHSLENNFLKDYLENPNSETGRAAIERIGESQLFPEVGAGGYMYVPEGIRRLHLSSQNIGNWEWIYPANQFFSEPFEGKYLRIIPYLDVPFLVGLPNQKRGEIDDAIYGGKNASNVMHWATGLKYHMIPRDLLRDLFVGYEYWHMEGFDVLGEDSLNDLIGEEAGRLLGREIAAAQIRSKDDLRRMIDRSFRDSRAWVGALVRFRQKDLDNLILSYNPPKTNYWKGDP